MGHSFKESYDPTYCPDEQCLTDYKETAAQLSAETARRKEAEEVIRCHGVMDNAADAVEFMAASKLFREALDAYRSHYPGGE